MDGFQSYLPLPHMLREAGKPHGDKLVTFGEHEMKESLYGAIHKQQQSKLSNINWDFLENPCHESVAKLESLMWSQ